MTLDVVTTELDDFAAQQPAAGAVVALDLPGGVRVEQTVGADGRVLFEGLDWSLPESAAVTAYLPGYLPLSFAGLTAETVPVLAELDGTEVLTLALIPFDPQLVVLSGVATQMSDTSHVINVSATTRCRSEGDTGAGWVTHVQPELPVTLVAVEHHAVTPPTVSLRGFEREWLRWAEQEQDAVSGDAMGIVIDLDAGALAATDVSGSFAIPDHGISSFFTKAGVRVVFTSADSGSTALLGYAQRVDVVAPGGVEVEYDVRYVAPAAVQRPLTHHFLHRDDARSALLVPGYPTAGAQPGVLPEPVDIENSAEGQLGELLWWEMNETDAADAALRLQLTIREKLSGIVRWRLIMPPGTTELILPRELPSNAEPDAVLGTKPLAGVIEHCEAIRTPEAYRGLCLRSSRSLPVSVFRPAAWGSPLDDDPEAP